MEAVKSFKRLATLDTIKSFKGYDKVNEDEDKKFKKETRNRIILIIAAVIILTVIIGVVIGVGLSNHNNGSTETSPPSSPISVSSITKIICKMTRYPDSCLSSISTAEGSNATDDPRELFRISMKVASDEIGRVSEFIDTFSISSDDKRLTLAIRDCKELFADAFDRFQDSIASVQNGLDEDKIDDIRSWLSAAVTDQQTCLQGFEGTTGDDKDRLESRMGDSTKFTSNSLAIATGILKLQEKLKYFKFKINRRLIARRDDYIDGFPAWVSGGQRRVLLQQSTVQLSPNVTVATDGSGDVKTINEAVKLVPNKNVRSFLIYVKAGVYKENVVFDKNKWNVVVYGDGMYKTIVDGKLSFADGLTTFSTATFVAVGMNFMARDIGFRNSAGPKNHQAVAIRVGSDHSVFYRCSFDGFQDTLYVHSLRQFYRECDIIGTIDFIFGDATVILQNCKIMPRQALSNQQNTVTAQGKHDPNESTGISIQGCRITPYDTVTVPTFLGRPWTDYSTTIVMQSDIGAVVSPAGWMPWVAGTVPPSTIYYAEYQNTGAGASVANRVKWSGFKSSVSDKEAEKFTVGTFLKGKDWIPASGVQFQSSLGQ